VKSRDGEMISAFWATLEELEKTKDNLFPVFADSLELIESRMSTRLDAGGNPYNDPKTVRVDGGPGSGNHNHKGVPGQRGGSAPSNSFSSISEEYQNSSLIAGDEDLNIPPSVNPCIDMNAIKSFESKFQGMENEVICMYDRKGKPFFEPAVGTEHSCKIPAEYEDQTDGMVVSHIHQKGGTFSYKDIKAMINYNLYAVRAAGPNETYQLRRVGGGIRKSERMKENYRVYFNRIAKQTDEEMKSVVKRFYNRELSVKEATKMQDSVNLYQRRALSKWFVDHAWEYGYEYSKDSK